MRSCKKNITKFIYLAVIILLYVVYRNYYYMLHISNFSNLLDLLNSNFFSKTALVSASFENPPATLSKLKEKFADIILEEKNSKQNTNYTDNREQTKNITPTDTTTEQINSDIKTSDKNKQDITPHFETEPTETSQSNNQPDAVEFVPEEHRGVIIEENFKGGQFPLYISTNPGFLSNRTRISSDTLKNKINNMPSIKLNLNDQPQVLLFSTHATESFEPCDRNFYDKRYNSRSTDNDKNVTQIEDKIAQQLNNNGINTIVDKTQHDFPSYNGSYNRSATTIKNYLAKYPSIKIILDIHRDAIERENGERVKPIAMINNKKAAQIMIISGCDDGSMNFPNWADNLNFAIDLQKTLENNFPGITRPIFFCYRKYNMNLSPCSLLIEFGSNSNSLHEVLYSGELMGKALSELILSYAHAQ